MPLAESLDELRRGGPPRREVGARGGPVYLTTQRRASRRLRGLAKAVWAVMLGQQVALAGYHRGPMCFLSRASHHTLTRRSRPCRSEPEGGAFAILSLLRHRGRSAGRRIPPAARIASLALGCALLALVLLANVPRDLVLDGLAERDDRVVAKVGNRLRDCK